MRNRNNTRIALKCRRNECDRDILDFYLFLYIMTLINDQVHSLLLQLTHRSKLKAGSTGSRSVGSKVFLMN